VRLEVIYAETTALLSRGRGRLYSQLFLLKENDILEINIC
jgi:hypothetical protein